MYHQFQKMGGVADVAVVSNAIHVYSVFIRLKNLSIIANLKLERKFKIYLECQELITVKDDLENCFRGVVSQLSLKLIWWTVFLFMNFCTWWILLPLVTECFCSFTCQRRVGKSLSRFSEAFPPSRVPAHPSIVSGTQHRGLWLMGRSGRCAVRSRTRASSNAQPIRRCSQMTSPSLSFGSWMVFMGLSFHAIVFLLWF